MMILVLKSQKKKKNPFISLPMYTWVASEVRMYSFIFQNTKSITNLKDRVNLTYLNNFDWVIVNHCLPSEWVFLSTDKNQPNFMNACEDMFKDLDITFLFFRLQM